jgi:hypothetical protein
MLLALPARADSTDILTRRLLAAWKDREPSIRMFAEIIAPEFSSGLSWRGSLPGKAACCPPPDLKAARVMLAFERFP